MSKSTTPTLPKNISRTLKWVGAIWLVYRVWKEVNGSHRRVPAHTTHAGIKSLVKQTARWSLAAEQDRHPVIAVLHANYGVGYWSALRSLATLETISRIANLDAATFEKRIYNIQAKATRALFQHCPQLKPADATLGRLAHRAL